MHFETLDLFSTSVRLMSSVGTTTIVRIPAGTPALPARNAVESRGQTSVDTTAGCRSRMRRDLAHLPADQSLS